MNTISGFPYFEIKFNKEGDIHHDQELKQVLDFISQGNVTDLFVISHGWNNTKEEAHDLYNRFFATMRLEINKRGIPNLESRTFAVLGIFWPSKRFPDEDKILSAAANIGNHQGDQDQIKKQLESLKGVFDRTDADLCLERAKILVDQVDIDEKAAVELVDIIRSLPLKDDVHPEDNTDEFFKLSGSDLIEKLGRPDIPIEPANEIGGAADFNSSSPGMDEGEAASFNFIGGVKSAVLRVLNFTTYYQMKERAGVVGRRGAYQVLRQIREKAPTLKMHLIGHSFGGRLVTSITAGPDEGLPVHPSSLTLLQAAFSHNGFAENFDGARDGFFRKVIKNKMVEGPILVTHSVKDLAVGKAYPIASKLSGDDSATFGGPKSRYGGIGRNGAQFTPEADNNTPLGSVASSYSFQSGMLYNLKADTLITGHSDVTKAEIVHAVLSAVAVT